MRNLCAAALVAASIGAASVAAQQQPAQPDQQNVVGGLLAQQAGRRGGGPPGPAPRNASGRVLLQAATPKDKGVWLPGPGITGVPILEPDKVPFQPWARKVLENRLVHEFEPHTRCKPSGLARAFQTPYGVEFVERPELQRIFIFDVGGPHTFRTVFMDGRSHPKDLHSSYYGHSVGWWEGDTLVIDTVGFNEGFWLDRMGAPHTEQLHTVERLTRTDQATMQYEMTIDDPNVYTAPWVARFTLGWESNTELFEYVCQEANYAHDLMLGTFNSMDRTTPIVP